MGFGGARCWLVLPALLLLLLASRAATQQHRHATHVDRTMGLVGVTPEQIWTNLLSAHPDPAKAIVVEVGVADGEQCAQAADRGFGKVVCFEPSPINYNRSRDTLERRRTASWKDVQLIAQAASDTSGATLEFHTIGNTGDHAGKLFEGEIPSFHEPGHVTYVPSIALDDHFSSTDMIYLMKIDTQGYDGMVLKGMSKLMSQHRVRYILTELWPQSMKRAMSCVETLTMIASHGYSIHELSLQVFFNEQRPSQSDIFMHPGTFPQLCEWYLSYTNNTFGLWTDLLLVPASAHAQNAAEWLQRSRRAL